MNIAEWLLRRAHLSGESPALFSGSRCDFDYRTFALSVAKIGAILRTKYRIEAGDRVALYMHNSPEYLLTMFGVLWCGGVIVPINSKLHPREAAWIVENSGSKAIFLDHETGEGVTAFIGGSVSQILPHSTEFQGMQSRFVPIDLSTREDKDLAWLFYTSGTTGRPKGVMLCHGNLMAMSLSYLSDVDRVFPSDAYIYAAPMSHGAGLYAFVNVLMGSRHVVPASGRFIAEEFLELAQTLRNATVFFAPTMVRKLADQAKASVTENRSSGIRTIVYGGAPMYAADMVEYLSLFGSVFVQIYGQGECPMTITSLPRHDHTIENIDVLASIGTAMSSVEVRTVTADGKPQKAGEVGEIEVRGAPVMLGYWDAPTATDAALKDGWLRTGDVGWLSHTGYLHLSGRSKDVIISGGSNIYPCEVEEVLATHPDVKEVSVIGLPDRLWGEAVTACVVFHEGRATSAKELDELCINAIAKFKRPKTYIFMTELPKNNYGKILKSELRLYAQKTEQDGPAAESKDGNGARQ